MTKIRFLVLFLLFLQSHLIIIASQSSTSAVQEHFHVQKTELGTNDGIQLKAISKIGARGGGGGARGGFGGGGGSRGGFGGGRSPGGGGDRRSRGGRGSRVPFIGGAAAGAAAATAARGGRNHHHGSACPTAHFSSTLPLFLLALAICINRY